MSNNSIDKLVAYFVGVVVGIFIIVVIKMIFTVMFAPEVPGTLGEHCNPDGTCIGDLICVSQNPEFNTNFKCVPKK